MRNRAFPSLHCDLRFELHCDLRSSAEGFAALDVISVQTRRATDGRPYFFLPASYNFPRPKGDEGRPVIAVKTNMSFLIERNNSVQSGDF